MKMCIALVMLALGAAGCDLGQTLFCPPFSSEVANNGLDDDCDGATDECSRDVDCDDGQSCSQDRCLMSGLCQHEPVAGNPACEDGDANPCTEGRCQQGACAAVALTDGAACPDDGNPCSLDLCSAGECGHPQAADDLPCDDGQFCTEGDRCLRGECRGATLRDCTPAVLECVARWSCDEGRDSCQVTFAEDNTECDDQVFCTVGDRCTAGQCLGTASRNCNDSINCTQDSCWDSPEFPGYGDCLHEPIPCCAGTDDLGVPVSSAVGRGPKGAFRGDFNADGIPDLASANWRADTISVLIGQGSEGRGDGTFAPAVPFPTGDLPEWMTGADFNSDGILDLATANRTSGDISVLLGQGTDGRGDGTFAAAASYPSGDSPYHLVAADLDSDGILDLVVCNFGAGGPGLVSLFFGHGQDGRGDGTFAPAQHLQATGGCFAVAVADLNSDGILDVAVGRQLTSTLSIFFGMGANGRGDGTFSEPPTDLVLEGISRGLVVADFNADTLPDLAVASYTTSAVEIFAGQGSNGVALGIFAAQGALQVSGALSFSVVALDLDRDHILDLVTSNTTDYSLSLFKGLGTNGRGNGLFTVAERLPVGQPSGAGPFVGPYAILADDFNGDGLLDLATDHCDHDAFYLFPGQGQGARPLGSLRALPGLPLPGAPSAGLAGDLDLDGRPDVAAVVGGDRLHVAFGVGPGAPDDGPFEEPEDVDLLGPASALATADFAFDGIPDLAVALPGSGQVALLRGAGSNGRPARGFSLVGVAAAGAGVIDLVAADLDGDRIPDLATANPTAGTVSVLLGLGTNARGSGNFAAPVALALGGAPRALEAADVNADAILDLLVVDQAGDQLVVLLGNGGDGRPDGTFSAAQRYPVGDGPTALALGDFDRDHVIDLAVADTAAGTLSVLLGGGSGGRGDGTFAAAVPVTACAEPLAVHAVDLDADDILDLLVACGGDGAIALLPGQGADGRGDGTFGAPRLFPVGGRPAGLLVTDQEPNGVQDALALCQETNELVLLLGQADCVGVP